MTQIAFKIAVYSLLLNIAISIMPALIPGMGNSLGGLSYDSTLTDGYIVGLNGSLQTSTIAEATATDYFMDSIHINSIVKFLSVIPKSLYALPIYFKSSLGIYMDASLSALITNALSAIITIAYSLGILSLFIGKDIISGN